MRHDVIELGFGHARKLRGEAITWRWLLLLLRLLCSHPTLSFQPPLSLWLSHKHLSRLLIGKAGKLKFEDKTNSGGGMIQLGKKDSF